jgi:hypothetical protein
LPGIEEAKRDASPLNAKRQTANATAGCLPEKNLDKLELV